jgi:hypothetical protein
VEARSQDPLVSTERLVHAHLRRLDLVDGTRAAATDAGTPNAQAPHTVAAAHQTGLVAGALEFLAFEVFEVVLVALVDDLVARSGHVI